MLRCSGADSRVGGRPVGGVHPAPYDAPMCKYFQAWFALALSVAAAAFAAAPEFELPRPAGPSIEESPAAVVERMRRRYADEPAAEEITIRVTSDGQTQGDRIVFRNVPGAAMKLEMGAITVVLDAGGLRASHRGNRGAYFAAKDPEDQPLEALRRSLPPTPIIQPALALAKDPAQSGLSPYLAGVTWSEARTYIEAVPPTTILMGEGSRGAAAIVSDASTGAVLRVTMWLERGRTLIDAESAALAPPVEQDVRFDEGGRRPSESITALSPSVADTRVGDPLPELSLRSQSNADEQADLRGPAAALFFMNVLDFRAAQTASRASAVVQRSVEGFRMFPTVVFDPIQPQKELMMGRLTSLFETTGLWHTSDPGATAERFVLPAEAGRPQNLLVVWNRAGRVTLIRPIEPEMSEEDMARITADAARRD